MSVARGRCSPSDNSQRTRFHLFIFRNIQKSDMVKDLIKRTKDTQGTRVPHSGPHTLREAQIHEPEAWVQESSVLEAVCRSEEQVPLQRGHGTPSPHPHFGGCGLSRGHWEVLDLGQGGVGATSRVISPPRKTSHSKQSVVGLHHPRGGCSGQPCSPARARCPSIPLWRPVQAQI